MDEALKEARKALSKNEIPVGAIIVLDGKVIGRGHNLPITSNDPSAHAEIRALRAACRRIGNYRLSGTEMYVTLEPCVMCAGALLQARIGRLYFGASDAKGGYRKFRPDLLASLDANHRLEVIGGVLEKACTAMLQGFFKTVRQGKRKKRL
jgi:tRNA(adenine34) deaminase